MNVQLFQELLVPSTYYCCIMVTFLCSFYQEQHVMLENATLRKQAIKLSLIMNSLLFSCFCDFAHDTNLLLFLRSFSPRNMNFRLRSFIVIFQQVQAQCQVSSNTVLKETIPPQDMVPRVQTHSTKTELIMEI